jgi:hypothetical protein
VSERDNNLRKAVAYLHLILAVERFYDDEDAAIKKTIKALEDRLR